MGVRAYVNRTTDKQDVIFVCPTPETYKISNNHYETLISKEMCIRDRNRTKCINFRRKTGRY